MARSFKEYNPLYKLNMGLIRSEVFPEKRAFRREPSLRYKRFSACMESFSRNYIRLHRLLDRFAEDLNVSYKRKNRRENRIYRLAKETIFIGNDLVMLFIVIKILLDDIVFFTPFYYKDPITLKKKGDLRDSEWAWPFKTMEKYFFEKKTFDKDFVDIIEKNRNWTDEVCNIRNFLMHDFHDLIIDHDDWTYSYYAFLYEFNKRKYFIPDILTYTVRIYYRFVKFMKDYEEFFKKRCEANFPSFKYFDKGVRTGGVNKTHFFFGGLGRLLDNKILIRIHPNLRSKIQPILKKVLREEIVMCGKCNSYDIDVRSTVENFVLISIKCNCGNALSVPMIVEKKFYPHFMDKGRRNLRLRWGLIPYTLDKN